MGSSRVRAAWVAWCIGGMLLIAGCDMGRISDDGGNSPDGGGGTFDAAGGYGPSAGIAGTGGGSSLGGASVGSLANFLGDPAYPDTFWKVASQEESRIDSAPLEAAVDLIEASRWEIHSFLIARHGKLVFERYGWKSGKSEADPDKIPHQALPTERHLQFSATKSVLSALVGIALDEGAIPSLDERAVSWFPDYAALNPSPEKERITLEDLLTMRSGLEFVEGEQGTFDEPDPARAMLARDVVDTPVGTVWNYSSGGSDIIAEILRTATGFTPLEYANAKLFGPLGVVDPPWVAGRNGTNHGGWGLSLTSREMARFGELFRQRGAWGGRQLVPAEWTETSTAARCTTTWGGQYAYHWWVSNQPAGFFNALGAFGQAIYVGRDQGLVVVFTGDLPNETANTIFQRILREFVVPALR